LRNACRRYGHASHSPCGFYEAIRRTGIITFLIRGFRVGFTRLICWGSSTREIQHGIPAACLQRGTASTSIPYYILPRSAEYLGLGRSRWPQGGRTVLGKGKSVRTQNGTIRGSRRCRTPTGWRGGDRSRTGGLAGWLSSADWSAVSAICVAAIRGVALILLVRTGDAECQHEEPGECDRRESQLSSPIRPGSRAKALLEQFTDEL
jgi:hypothetical protein